MKLLKHISLRQVIFVCLLTLVMGTAIFLSPVLGPAKFEMGSVTLPDGSVILVEVADTPSDYRQGLMDRKQLAPDSGMLFVFSVPGIYPFWMKNTHFDLDFIWLSQGRVVDLHAGVPAGAGLADDHIAVVQPDVSVDAVLEVPAGFIYQHQIQVGDQLVYTLPTP